MIFTPIIGPKQVLPHKPTVASSKKNIKQRSKDLQIEIAKKRAQSIANRTGDIISGRQTKNSQRAGTVDPSNYSLSESRIPRVAQRAVSAPGIISERIFVEPETPGI